MSSGKVLLGLLAGVAAGAMLGVLLAPDSGKNTRRKVLEKGDDYADGLKEKLGDFMAQAQEKIETLKDEVVIALQDVKTKPITLFRK